MTCKFVTKYGVVALKGTEQKSGNYIAPIKWVCTKCGKTVHSTVNVEVPFSWKKCEKDKDVKV